MAAVKGSKQFEMVVVPHRPRYKVMIFLAFVGAMAALGWLTYQVGMNQGMALKVEVVKERDMIRGQLEESRKLIAGMRQEIADLKVGGQIDDKATEEVRGTIESLQEQIAELNEEISFYKGVMLPNVATRGLRIERLDLSSIAPNRIRYSLLLTQIADKHDYVQGGVQISVVGRQNEQEKSLLLSEVDTEKPDAVRFRFRYFQNINGEMLVPAGFEPREVMVVAQPNGSGAQRLEKRFDWSLNGG